MIHRIVSNEGFSLVEVLITMAVVSVVTMGIMIGNTTIQQSSEAAFQRTRAMQDANQVLENIRKTAQTQSFPDGVVNNYRDGEVVNGYDELIDEIVTVSYTDTNGDADLTNDSYLDVSVNVTWLENGRREVNSSLRGLVVQR